MSEFRKALSNAELEEGSILAVRINGERIALYKIGGEVYAANEMCSHSDRSLEDFDKIVENDQVECICQGAKIPHQDRRSNAATGRSATHNLSRESRRK
jgi:3-phenylpropionate/trans-cinnamate dioxygenase ferredoxin component